MIDTDSMYENGDKRAMSKVQISFKDGVYTARFDGMMVVADTRQEMADKVATCLMAKELGDRGREEVVSVVKGPIQ